MSEQLPYRATLFLAILLVMALPATAATFSWSLDDDGIWERRTHWRPFGIPDGPADEAIFGRTISSDRTVSISTAKGVRVNRLFFDNPNSYTLDLGGRSGGITLTNERGMAAIEVAQGAHSLDLPVGLMDSVDLTAAARSSIEFGGALAFDGHRVRTLGEGSYVFNSSVVPRSPTGFLIGEKGTISGSGAVGANVMADGATIAPGGATPGTLTIAGDFELGSNSNLVIDVAGDGLGEFDAIDVSGQATLGGTLTINIADPSTITPGIRLEFVQASSLEGTFSDIFFNGGDDFYGIPIVPPLDDVFHICLSYEGDMDCDGLLSDLDLQAFALGLIDPVAYSQMYFVEPSVTGDMDDNGRLDFDDIELFAAQLPGASYADVLGVINGMGSQVPEPATELLLLCGVVLVPLLRRLAKCKAVSQ